MKRCINLDLYINDGYQTDSSCKIFAGSFHSFMERFQKSKYEKLFISSTDCPFLMDDDENDKMFIEIKWDDVFTCPAGQYRDDNADWLHVMNPDSCETCATNYYSSSQGSSQCTKCPDGKVRVINTFTLFVA